MEYPNKSTENFRLRTVILSILLLLLSALFLVCIESTDRAYDNDLWFHLQYGKHYTENHTWSIEHSVYSWTPATRQWDYITWIGSTAIYLVYKYISPDAVMLIPFIVLVCVLIVYILFLRSIAQPYSFITMSIFFIAACYFYLPVVKPADLTILLFSVCIAIYYSCRHNRNRLYWAYPPLFLLWVNTHGGFIFGMFFLICAFSLDLCFDWKKRMLQSNRTYLLGFGTALFVSILVLGINPDGFGYFVGLYREITHSEGLDPAKYINEFTDLWSKMNPSVTLNPGAVGTSWIGVFMLGSYALLALLGIKKGRSLDLTSIFLLTIFFIMGMKVYRLLTFFCLIWTFSISWFITTKRPVLSLGKLAFVTLAFACYFIGNQANNFLLGGDTFHPFKHNIDFIYPTKAVDIIKQYKLPGEIIHDYGTGGYLIWWLYPEYKVFADPRGGPYRQDVLEDCFSLQRASTIADLKTILHKYPQAKTAIFSLVLRNLSQLFMQLPDWRLVYFDQAAVIFVKTDALHERIPVDMSPQRFARLNHPLVLYNLFFMYRSINSEDSARLIRKYFETNVSSYYLYKNSYLELMDLSLPKSGSKTDEKT